MATEPKQTRLKTLVTNKFVEIISALVMIIAGLALSIILTGQAWATALGAVLTSIGGVLLSWASASVNTKEAAIGILQPQLRQYSRHLGDIYSQINSCILDVQQGNTTPSSGVANIAQSMVHLRSLHTDVQHVIGEPFNLQAVVDNFERLNKLTGALFENQGGGEKSVANEHVLDEIKNVQLEIAKQISSGRGIGIDASKRLVRVQCPHCSNRFVGVRIGLNNGDSAHAHCGRCSQHFHVHRGGDGTIFTKLPGSRTAIGLASTSPGSRHYLSDDVANCLDCGQELSILIGDAPGDTGSATCDECDMRYIAHRDGGGKMFIKWASPTPVNEYVHALRQQKVPVGFPRSIWRASLDGTAMLFRSTPRFMNWGEYEAQLAVLLTKTDTFDTNLHDPYSIAKKVRTRLYKARLFRLLKDGQGIEFTLGEAELSWQTIARRVDEDTIRRIVGTLPPNETVSPEKVNELIIGVADAVDDAYINECIKGSLASG